MFPFFSIRNQRKNAWENERCPSPRIFHPGGMKYSAFNYRVLIFILFSIILSRVPQLNFLPRRIPRVSINDTSRKRAHLLLVRPLSIIHVARKLITRPIHCGFVNLFDGWIVPGACHPEPPLSSGCKSASQFRANLREYFISTVRERRSPPRRRISGIRNIIRSGNWRGTCPCS